MHEHPTSTALLKLHNTMNTHMQVATDVADCKGPTFKVQDLHNYNSLEKARQKVRQSLSCVLAIQAYLISDDKDKSVKSLNKGLARWGVECNPNLLKLLTSVDQSSQQPKQSAALPQPLPPAEPTQTAPTQQEHTQATQAITAEATLPQPLPGSDN